MGSASSRMSASPALVHPASSSDASTVSTSTSTLSTSTSTLQESSPQIKASIPQPERPPTPPITSPIDLKLDKGKGKEVVDDKEEGEISEDETLPEHHAKPPSVSSINTPFSGRPAYDSYRPQHQPREVSQSHHLPQYPRPNQHTQPRQRIHPSQSPQQMHFPQGSRPIHATQQTQHDPNKSNHRQHASKLSNGSSQAPISPKTGETSSVHDATGPANPLPLSGPITATQPRPTSVSTQSSPEDSLALPSTLTTEEAEQYMDIIRNLMSEGVRPDVLIKRGATPKYVSMVCREIVKGSRNKKGGLAQTQTETTGSASTLLEPALAGGSTSVPTGPQSPSAGSVDLTRDSSASSISSVETSIKVERIVSPKLQTRLIPTSSWVPTPRLPNSPVRVESYRPGRPSGSTATSSQAVLSNAQSSSVPSFDAPLGPRLGPGSIARPVVSKNSLRARASDLSPVVKRPGSIATNGQFAAADTAVRVDSHGPHPHVAPTPVAHGAHQVLASLDDTQNSPSADMTPRPSSVPSSVTVLPLASTSAPTATKTSTMNALLESKRKAMESMRRARKASDDVARPEPRPIIPPPAARGSPLPDLSTSPPPILPAVPEPVMAVTQENLEDQVAALEQEVLGLQDAEPMIVDEEEEEEEEGEIPDDVPPPVQPRMVPIIPATTPIRLNKRPNAEDMMDAHRSQSISSRSLHPAKRRQFGTALRMKRLIISLDDSDDEDNEDDISTPTAVDLEADRQRLLKEKDDNIMRLREQILRLQARAKRDKKDKAREIALGATPAGSGPVTPAEMAATVEDTVMVDPDVAVVDSADAEALEIPASAGVPPIGGTPISQNESVIGQEETDNSMVVDVELDKDSADMDTPHLSSSLTRIGDTSPSEPKFEAYRPILKRYPQLVSSSTIKSTLPQFTWSQPTSTRFDASRLSSIILTRRTQLDPSAVVCGAESAGGSCADPTCSDLHLSRDFDRPHEEDLIEYLFDTSVNVDRSTLEQFLIKAGVALEISNIPSSAKSKKKKNTEPTYSMAVAEQMIMTVVTLLHNDRSVSKAV